MKPFQKQFLVIIIGINNESGSTKLIKYELCSGLSDQYDIFY